MTLREPLVIPFAGFALGILLSTRTSFRVTELLLAGAAFVALALVARVRRAMVLSIVASALAMVSAGALADVIHRPGAAPELDTGEGEVLTLAGCVVQPPVFSIDREQFVLELEPGARANVSLSIKDGDEPPQLLYGQRIELDARIRRARNYQNPGAFDYVRYLARQQVYWSASARASDPIRIMPGSCGSRVESFIFRLRTAALERIEKMYPGDDYATGMTEAILIGETGKLQKVWTEVFRRTGTFHALVISGMHIIVLAGTVLFLLRLCMLNEMTALVIAAILAWIYTAVSGWQAPAVRAAGGFTLYLAGRYMFRRGRVLNLLSAIALAYLAWDPGQLFEASFQLSFLCVASIGAFASPLTEFVLRRYRDAGRSLDEPKRDMKSEPVAAEFRIELRLLVETITLWTRIPAVILYRSFEIAVRLGVWVTEMVILSGVVQVALALPMALYFHRISITGLTANLAVVPLMNMMIPVGFAAIFIGWWPLAALARVLLKLAAWAAAWHVQFEPSHRVPDPPVWLAVGLAAALVALAITVRVRTKWLYAALAATAICFGLMMAAPFRSEVPRGMLELTAIDVGQGDGLLLTTPAGQVILIDAGGFPNFGRKKKPNLDVGEDVISPYLWSRRIQHADVIVTTHAHEDHVGGLRALVDNFRPREIWTGAVPEDSVETDVLNTARARGIRVLSKRAGEAFDSGGVHFEVLAPAIDYECDARKVNNDSLVLRVRYGAHSFLLTGDMEREVEWGLLSQGVLNRTTVLKVPHHGSKTSSTEEFLEATQPEFALVSVGYGNLFHHPNPGVVERLAAHHADVWRTDQSGLITVRSDGHRLTLETNRDLARGGLTGPFQSW